MVVVDSQTGKAEEFSKLDSVVSQNQEILTSSDLGGFLIFVNFLDRFSTKQLNGGLLH